MKEQQLPLYRGERPSHKVGQITHGSRCTGFKVPSGLDVIVIGPWMYCRAQDAKSCPA